MKTPFSRLITRFIPSPSLHACMCPSHQTKIKSTDFSGLAFEKIETLIDFQPSIHSIHWSDFHFSSASCNLSNDVSNSVNASERVKSSSSVNCCQDEYEYGKRRQCFGVTYPTQYMHNQYKNWIPKHIHRLFFGFATTIYKGWEKFSSWSVHPIQKLDRDQFSNENVTIVLIASYLISLIEFIRPGASWTFIAFLVYSNLIHTFFLVVHVQFPFIPNIDTQQCYDDSPKERQGYPTSTIAIAIATKKFAILIRYKIDNVHWKLQQTNQSQCQYGKVWQFQSISIHCGVCRIRSFRLSTWQQSSSRWSWSWSSPVCISIGVEPEQSNIIPQLHCPTAARFSPSPLGRSYAL